MDLSLVYQPLFTLLLYLLPPVIIASLIKSPWFKGKFGEFVVNLSARWLLDKSRYHLIKNVTLPTEDGTTQIDHVLVSEFGVFVVETKKHQGLVSDRYGEAPRRPSTGLKAYRSPFFTDLKASPKPILGRWNLSFRQALSLSVFINLPPSSSWRGRNVTP